MRTALESCNHIALSVDLRACVSGGMHAMMDVYAIIGLRRW